MNIRRIRRLSKKVLPLSLVITLFGVPSFAKTVQTGDYEIVSSGTDKPKTEVTIDVYYPNKSYIDLLNASEEEYDKILVYRDEITVGEDGKYEVTFNVENLKTDEYTVCISKEDDSAPQTEKLLYSNPNDYVTAVDEINKVTSESELKGIIDKYSVAVGIKLADETEYNVDSVLKIMLNSIKTEKIDSTDIKSVQKCYELSKLVVSLNENKTSNINDKKDIIDWTKIGISDYYNKSYVTENVQKNLTSRISKKKFETVAELNKAVGEQFVLAVIEKSNSIDAIKEVINAFSNKIGSNANGISQRKLTALSGNSYSEFATLKTALNNLTESDDRGLSSGGGNRGSSGGTMSGGKIYPNTVSNRTNNKEDKKLNYYVFDDLETVEWAREAICSLAESGVLRGKEYKLFYPNDNVTREEFVKMLAVAYKLDVENKTAKFADVNADDWFMPYVAAVFENGIAKGISENLFGTGQNITRQDLAVMAYNAALKGGIEFNTEDIQQFSDDDEISDYAKTAVYALKSQDVVNGIDGKNFAPQDTATRAEAAKILYVLTALAG